ncbi:precorrin-6A/cobalt-precorrin-6A reductase [Streptomyces parvulus]|uniref:Uncharacterized protein n=1 Tax=Streptomyces parvulus TaxID=146923 RepID=A0A369UWZ7_9ACTN|nr:precorrin-6A/cobalt-precorrin-6A reductase [Streptomyces parvulus]RDD85276.1 hypothetical protein DVZ84_30630 [Streptomyces parvulus]
MTTLIIGSTTLANQLAMAYEYSEPDYVHLTAEDSDAETLASIFAGSAIDAVVNAAEPYAEESSITVAAACGLAGLPLLRAVPPSFSRIDGSSRWRWVESFDVAREAAAGFSGDLLAALHPPRLAARLGDLGGRTAGVHRRRLPTESLWPEWAREPERTRHGLAGALAVIDEHHARLVIAADSGDEDVAYFLVAAELRELDVVVVRRPDTGEREAVSDVSSVFAWLNGLGDACGRAAR